MKKYFVNLYYQLFTKLQAMPPDAKDLDFLDAKVSGSYCRIQ